MTIPTTVQILNEQVRLLEIEIKDMKDRLLVIEECTSSWDGRFDDLEKWQSEIDDRLDREL